MHSGDPEPRKSILVEIAEFTRALFRNQSWKPLVILFASTLCMVLYIYLNPPLNKFSAGIAEQVFLLPGDFPQYAWRFSMSSLFLGLIPLSIAFALGFKPRRLGLAWDWSFFRSKAFWTVLIGLVVVSVLSTKRSELFTFYPFAKSLIPAVKANPWVFGIHIALYTLTYYLPWEIMFRGILVFPFISEASQQSRLRLEHYPNLLVLAAVQTMPTTLMHISHPISEILGAIPFGIICAYLSLRFRTILAPLIIHASVGLLVDLSIILGS